MKRWVAPVLVLTVLGLASAWFFTRFERVPAREWVGPGPEARRDPFLAAGRFAGRMGLNSQPIRSLPELDRLPDGGALLLPAGRQAIDPRRLRRLLSWAEAGGHLLVEAELPGVADPLLDGLGVQRRNGRERDFKPPAVVTSQGRRLKVELSGRTLLRLPEDSEVAFSAGGPHAIVIASLETGRGMVTAAGSLDFARNGFIGNADNAEFLWHVLDLTAARELRIFLRQERLSLCGFLREHASPALIAAGALLALWLWSIGPRFGPVTPDLPPVRRRLLDHLRASGRYYWTRGLRARLVTAARDAALRHVAHVHPDFAHASADERARQLASLISVPLDEARRFMEQGDAASGADFVHLTHTAQKIHGALEKGNR